MKTPKTHPTIVGSTDALSRLAKGYNQPMNTMHLASNAPLVNKPRNATASLLRQAAAKIGKGQDRKKVLAQLVASTKRSPAAVKPPTAAQAATPVSGFGGAGFSGRDASSLGAASNPGVTTPAPPAPPAPPMPPKP